MVTMGPSLAPAAVTVYDKSGLVLKLSCERPLEASQTITLTATNTSDHDVTSLTLQAAVPKVGCYRGNLGGPPWSGQRFELFVEVLINK